jgi:hypothetical protein
MIGFPQTKNIMKNTLIPYFHINWNLKGYVDNEKFQGEKKDWFQTLQEKINYISAQIHKATLLGGANTIEINGKNLYLIKHLDYYNKDTKQIGGRYNVIINNSLDINSILIYHDSPGSIEIKKKKSIGLVSIINNK